MLISKRMSASSYHPYDLKTPKKITVKKKIAQDAVVGIKNVIAIPLYNLPS